MKLSASPFLAAGIPLVSFRGHYSTCFSRVFNGEEPDRSWHSNARQI